MVPQQLDGFHGKSRKNGDLGVPPHDLGHLQWRFTGKTMPRLPPIFLGMVDIMNLTA
jgi:hypothetical protein